MQACPRFTVIIPVYDREQELREALASVFAQTLQDFEIIIVTDGSPPATLLTIDGYRNDPRVRVFIYPDRSGNPSRGRNRGIIEARSEYVAFLDSDDQYFPGALETAHGIFESRKVDVVVGRASFLVDGTRNVRNIKTGDTNDVVPVDMSWLLRSNPFMTCTVTVRRNALLKWGGFRRDQGYNEDWELWTRLLYNKCRFIYTHQLFSSYRVHQGNAELDFIDKCDHWRKLALKNYMRPFAEWGV